MLTPFKKINLKFILFIISGFLLSCNNLFADCNPIGEIGIIRGEERLCYESNDSTYIYSIDSVENATSYEWSLPIGITGNSSSTLIKITLIDTTFESEISVKAINECYESEISTLPIIINTKPAQPAYISIESKLCSGIDSYHKHSATTISNATSYLWTLPDGSVINSSYNYVILNYGEKAETLTLSVAGQNECGISATKKLDIKINKTPDIPEIIVKDEQILICIDSGYYKYSWRKDLIPMENGNKQFLVLEDEKEGEYDVSVTTYNGCVSEISKTQTISQKNSGLTISVLPNLIKNNKINFTINTSEDNYINYRLVNSNGILIKQGHTTTTNNEAQQTIDVTSIQAGIYHLIVSGNNSGLVNEKIIIQ
jgi:hypothetical protein